MMSFSLNLKDADDIEHSEVVPEEDNRVKGEIDAMRR